jgi:hypothetical protein
MSLPSAGDLLKIQLRHAWLDQRRVLEALTSEEYFWEPAAPFSRYSSGFGERIGFLVSSEVFGDAEQVR